MSRIPSITAAALLAVPLFGRAQQAATIPTGTPLWLVNQKTVRLRVGQPIVAAVKYPVYAGERLVIPAGAMVTGRVTAMEPDHAHRVTSRLRGDFTPFSQPAVEFTSVAIHGSDIPLHLTTVADGSAQTEITPPPPSQGGLIRRQIHTGMEVAKDRMRMMTAPGKRDRLIQYAYTQLPYHPQDILKDTVWMPETSSEIAVPEMALATPQPGTATQPETVSLQRTALAQPSVAAQPAVAAPAKGFGVAGLRAKAISALKVPASPPNALRIQAAMDQEISSAHSHAGDPVTATVVAPVYAPDGSLAVPAGAQVIGTITRAQPARRFGRAGVLRYRFTEIKLAGTAEPTHMQASVAGVDAATDANLALDSEGNAKPKAQDKVVVPLLLLALAAQPLDREENGGSGIGRRAVASNALGAVGFIVGTAGGSPYVASGIGYYGSALSIYNRWIKHGEETRFQRHTRLTLDTTVRQTQMLHASPAGQ